MDLDRLDRSQTDKNDLIDKSHSDQGPISVSPSEILYSDNKRKFRFYERSYKTNEPLPDKPEIDWSDTGTVEPDEFPPVTPFQNPPSVPPFQNLPSVPIGDESEFSSPVSSKTGREDTSSKRIQTDIF